ncbi:biotin transporter BioY [Alicyclobacillus cellulosilyticus]|uniref:Biotin transporter n=1 Tax=Alicyclobacillus cellulosilyticus TaxID=1003997 RepID=A0A917NKS4_9BACL|nr:biotin transporter BioY [Alicyclobacillus cellulosilyticus]GGJ05334.1 biotin transporter BioY [Alicyclobacillus cellulosilyticus]
MQRGLTVRGVVFSALFAALTVVLDLMQLHLPFSPVPVTLGNLSVMLAGAILGPWYGFLSQFLVVLLTALGLPMLDGRGGLSVLLGYTGGYVWMWPFDALLVGWCVRRIRVHGHGVWAHVRAYVLTFLAVEVFGSLLCYVSGVPWLAHVFHWPLSKAIALGFWPYLPGDTAKAVLTTIICLAVRPVYPPERLLGQAQGGVVELPK